MAFLCLTSSCVRFCLALLTHWSSLSLTPCLPGDPGGNACGRNRRPLHCSVEKERMAVDVFRCTCSKSLTQLASFPYAYLHLLRACHIFPLAAATTSKTGLMAQMSNSCALGFVEGRYALSSHVWAQFTLSVLHEGKMRRGCR